MSSGTGRGALLNVNNVPLNAGSDRFRGVLKLALSLLVMTTSFAASAQGEPEGVEQMFERANARVQRGQAARAMSLYREIVEIEPDWAVVWYNMAEVSRELGDEPACVRYFSRYLFLDPEAADSRRFNRSYSACQERITELGTLTVRAEQPDAAISVDGLVLAVGVLEAHPLEAGKHIVRVECLDYEAGDRAVEVTPGDETVVGIQLEAIPHHGNLHISANLAGASVTIEGVPVGTTPIEAPINLPVGRHLVLFQLEGHHDWIRRVEIRRDRDHYLDVEIQERVDERTRWTRR